MTTRHPKLPHIYLKPGEFHFATKPTVVTTVLGSCVSVTMFDVFSRAAAICHALLPDGPRDDAFRYVDSSIFRMLEMFMSRGITPRQLQVKLFGGSDMLGATASRPGVGSRNVDIAHQVLASEGLEVVAADVGGTRGRKLFFYTHTGEVLLKRLNRTEADS
ncbi:MULTISPECIES: chemotaxis protein CheD [Geobacter]|uniref:Probable chemoreceptor glutamine deamidase CheD n=2 Tax=Geobacter TaxID=28231 RepID=A0A0C1QQ26_9BACT|nr:MULTISPECIES: chemotaxis protein CheD [Geobacter]ANA40731.1 chemotaxis protein CheD [Geobacter anodireducens]KIE42802.1 chemotaxis protein CheD [Geobacter soli]MBE2889602.1 chemotaxis protein CheD [Geobacter anodireducens]HMN02663.1 chemotaxis protein CheD [Geobacter anodireducens]